jgi:hypothetical protein
MQRYSSQELQKGQVLLVIVLVMIVALTIGLSVVTRSVTNLQISSEEESSQRALSAAEAGIEKALQSNQSTGSLDLQNNSKIEKVTVNKIEGEEFLINNGNTVLKDDGADVWLSTYDSNPKYQNSYSGNVTFFWGSANDVCADGTTNTAAALQILVISKKSGGGMELQTHPFDPCSGSVNRAAENNFCTALSPVSAKCPQTMRQQAATVKGKQFQYSTTIPVTDGVMTRIVPLYASTALGVRGGNGPLPSQGRVIESLGASGNTQRKISVYKGFAKIPVEFFPYVLFSP